MVRALKEYGGSTALYTAYVVYSVCTIFKLLCTAYKHIYALLGKIRKQLEWADGASEQNVGVTGRVDNS